MTRATGQYKMKWEDQVTPRMLYRLSFMGDYDLEQCHKRITQVRDEIEQEQKIKRLREILDGIWITPIQRTFIAYFLWHIVREDRLSWDISITPIPNKLDGHKTYDMLSFIYALQYVQDKRIRDDLKKFLYQHTVPVQRLLSWMIQRKNVFGILRNDLIEIIYEYRLNEYIIDPEAFECPSAEKKVDKLSQFPKFIIDTTNRDVKTLLKIDGEVVSDYSEEITKCIKYVVEDLTHFALQGYISQEVLYIWIASDKIDVVEALYKEWDQVRLPKKLALWVNYIDRVKAGLEDLQTFHMGPKEVKTVQMYLASGEKGYINKLASRDNATYLVKSGRQLYIDKSPELVHTGFIISYNLERPAVFIVDDYKVPMENALFRLEKNEMSRYIGQKVKIYKWEDKLYLKKSTDHDIRKEVE